MPTFEFLRLSLSVPTIGDLTKDYDRQEPDITRKEFLTKAFSERLDFFYKKKMYSYVPIPIKINRQDTFAGFIGKPVEELVNDGPDNFFALTPSNHYNAAFLAIDVSESRQIIAFEKGHDVGSPHSIISAMLEHYVKKRKGVSWYSDVEYISLEENFWQAAKKYRGQITELSFEFYPPNGLEGFDDFKKFDRAAKQQANGKSSEYSIKNPDGGVTPEGGFVEDAVEYASEGPGKITMKKGNRTLFNSRNAKRTKDVPESIMPRQGEGERFKILELLEWLFGKKDG